MEENFREINESIIGIGKRIIIIIDDLDRLTKEEVLEVLRIIRNTANFKNTIFIVAYDSYYIKQSLQEANITKPERYVEKIFQVEIPIPQTQPAIIVSQLYSLLDLNNDKIIITDITEKDALRQVISKFEKTTFGYENEDFDTTNFIRKYFKNIRDVKRFCNSFKINYPLIREEVDLEDHFLLEMLKFKFPEFYNLISERKYLVETTDLQNHQQEIIYLNVSFENDFITSNNVASSFLYNLPTDNLELINKTLKYLFRETSKDDSPISLSIRNPKNFLTYFGGNLFDKFSTVQFNKLLKNHNWSYIKDKISEWISKNPKYLLEIKIYLTETTQFASPNEFELAIELMMWLDGTFESINLSNEVFSRINDIEKNVETYYKDDEDKYTFLIENLLQNTSIPLISKAILARDIIYRFIKNDRSLEPFIDRDYIKNKLLDYLKEHLELNSGEIDDRAIFLYYLNYQNIDSENHIILNPKASKILLPYILAKPLGYIKQFIRPLMTPSDGKTYVGEPFDLKIMINTTVRDLKIFYFQKLCLL